MCFNSVVFDFKNLRLAGTLKKRFLTMKVVPFRQETASCVFISEAAICIKVPISSSSLRVRSSTSATDAIEARASPRKPIVFISNKSEALFIFEVACRSNDILASTGDMPFPSSVT